MEGSGEERCHLFSGDGIGGAVVVVVWWVAAFGDAGLCEAVDVGFVDGAVVVDEVVGGCRWEVEGSGEERCHLFSGDSPGGAVSVVIGRVASLGDAEGGQPCDIEAEDRCLRVEEVGTDERLEHVGTRGSEVVCHGEFDAVHADGFENYRSGLP